MGLTGLIAVIIPDTPDSVKIQIQREKLLAREVLFEAELDGKDKYRKISRIFFNRTFFFFWKFFFEKCFLEKKKFEFFFEFFYENALEASVVNNFVYYL
jgi:hypothetical protein